MMERHHHHHQHQKFEEKDVEKITTEENGIKQSSSSESSSPAHDFSFTISLHNNTCSSATTPDNKSKPPPLSSSFALDLSPADDIFFHGHLLPLHLLSHLPISPRSSTTSMDSFTLPARDYGSIITSSHKSNFTMDDCSNKNNNSSSTSSSNSSSNSSQESRRNNNKGSRSKSKSKSKSFSIFGFTRGRKEFQVTEKEEEDDDKEKQKIRKVRFDMVRVVKKYLRMVQPLVNFGGRKEKMRQSYSYSGNLSAMNKREVVKGRRGEYSAPASMRTSPTNSGLLLPTPTFSPASDSTMEELQAAIQAAIAHCKNSIAKDDKLKC